MLPLNRIVAVALILLLIIAFVLISVLGTGVGQLKTFSEAQSICGSLGGSSCSSVGDLPFAWITNRINTEEGSKTCADIMGCDTCESCGFV